MDVQKEVVDYLKEGLLLGYSKEHLKQELAAEGYTPDEIRIYFKALDPDRVEKQRKIKEVLWFFGAIVSFVVLVIVVSVLARAPLMPVLIGFSPTIISVFLSVVILEALPKHRFVVWVLPFLGAASFFAIGYQGQFALFENLDIASLTMFNLVASFAFPSIAAFTGVLDPAVRLVESPQEEESEKEPEKGVRDYLKEVHGAATQLNASIAKVYGQRKGGTPELRSKIRIKKEWIDTLPKDPRVNRELILSALQAIQERLGILYYAENDVFGTKELSLDHDPEGKSRIIDVLIDNDKESEQVLQTMMKSSMKAKELLES